MSHCTQMKRISGSWTYMIISYHFLSKLSHPNLLFLLLFFCSPPTWKLEKHANEQRKPNRYACTAQFHNNDAIYQNREAGCHYQTARVIKKSGRRDSDPPTR
ncbi:Uncharacterized protein TCM_029450 [Theobroma cacao]|uniref:Uncharacterized protein n=1 Tax=Theobroma cacao TaxID=3641 RepID=A0A061GEX5_THECC|nr:Uncharacterized protein TCM_029450 [Theobroma cacao]